MVALFVQLNCDIDITLHGVPLGGRSLCAIVPSVFSSRVSQWNIWNVEELGDMK